MGGKTYPWSMNIRRCNLYWLVARVYGCIEVSYFSLLGESAIIEFRGRLDSTESSAQVLRGNGRTFSGYIPVGAVIRLH